MPSIGKLTTSLLWPFSIVMSLAGEFSWFPMVSPPCSALAPGLSDEEPGLSEMVRGCWETDVWQDMKLDGNMRFAKNGLLTC